MREDLVEAQRHRLVGVADEAGDPRGVAHGAPRLVGEVHADQDVAGHPDPADQLALAVLDLGDLFHRDLDLEDVVLHVQGGDAGLEVGLHAVLVARVGVDDVPVAELAGEVVLERLDRVDGLEQVAVLVGRQRRPRPRRRRRGLVGRRPRRRAASSAVCGLGLGARRHDVGGARRCSSAASAPSGVGDVLGQHSRGRRRRHVGLVGPLVGHAVTSSLMSRRMRVLPSGLAARTAPALSRRTPSSDELGEAEVQHRHQRHHERDEHDDDDRVVHQLGAGRADDLAQLVEDLADEQAQRLGTTAKRGCRPARPCEPVGVLVCRRQSRCLFTSTVIGCLRAADREGNRSVQSWTNHTCDAGQEGLEPPTAGFGDRCSTN